MEIIKAKLQVGRTGKLLESKVTIGRASSRLQIEIKSPADKGADSRLSLAWPEAMAFAAAVCAKAAEMAVIFTPKSGDE